MDNIESFTVPEKRVALTKEISRQRGKVRDADGGTATFHLGLLRGGRREARRDGERG